MISVLTLVIFSSIKQSESMTECFRKEVENGVSTVFNVGDRFPLFLLDSEKRIPYHLLSKGCVNFRCVCKKSQIIRMPSLLSIEMGEVISELKLSKFAVTEKSRTFALRIAYFE